MSQAITVPPGASLNQVFADLAVGFQREREAATVRRQRAEQAHAATRNQPNTHNAYMAENELRDAKAHEDNTGKHVQALKSGVFRVGPGESGKPEFMNKYRDVIAAAANQGRLVVDSGEDDDSGQ